MKAELLKRFWLAGGLLLWALAAAVGQSLGPSYQIEFVDREAQEVEVVARYAVAGQAHVEWLMPVWSPGFYRVQDYAEKVRSLSARDEGGAERPVERIRSNRWRVDCGGASQIELRYRLLCDNYFVTTNWVGPEYAVLNGCATFIVPAEALDRPCKLSVRLPAEWNGCATALKPAAAEEGAYPFTADDYERLVDCPIVAGKLDRHEFSVAGVPHTLITVGEPRAWEAAEAAANIEKLVAATERFWGGLPFEHYWFLNVARRSAGGGLEHCDSTLITSSPGAAKLDQSWGWLAFVSHEYFHAINVKRLRPVELGPFDYEHPPRTRSLWVAEGLTTYFGNLMLARGGVGTADDFLDGLSSMIGQLQRTEGRLKQSLTDASLQVWDMGNSGVQQDPAATISYYVKGPVVGWLLDARIRRATGGKRSLDDAMRLAYERYAGEHGYTEAEFRGVCSEVAGTDLGPWFEAAIDQPGELDYAEALEWFGLEFTGGDDPQAAWKVRPTAGATAEQAAQWTALLKGDR